MSAWTRVACAACALCAAAPARAESVVLELGRKAHAAISAAQEDEVRERMQRVDDVFTAAELLLATDPIDSAGVTLSASAAGGYDVSRATTEASAELSAYLGSASCRTVWASLLVRGRTATHVDDRARAGGEAAGGVCFPKGIYLSDLFDLPIAVAGFPLRVEGRAALLKTPALTAARSALREPYSEAGFSVAIEGVRFLLGDGSPADRRRWIATPGVSVTQSWQWLGFPTGDPARLEVTLDMWFVRFHRRRPPLALADRSIDLFAFGAHGVRDENGAAVIDFWPLRLTGLGLGRVLVDASVGFSGVGTLDADGEQIPTTGLPDVAIVAAHAAVHLGTQRRSLSLGFDSTLDTNLRAELVHESRGWIMGRGGAGPLGLDARAFGGRAIHYLDLTSRGDERFVGASLDTTYALRPHLAVGVTLAATHSLHRDAILDDRVPPTGIRALLTLTATHALYQRQLTPLRTLRPDFLPPAPAPAPAPPSPTPAPPPSDSPPSPAPEAAQRLETTPHPELDPSPLNN